MGVLAVVIVPLVMLLYLILARVYMQLIALLFRIGENTSLIADRLGSGPAGGPSPLVAATALRLAS